MSKVAFVFPGQGAQYVGMGRALADHSPVARAVFEEADDALGFSLSTMLFEGPEETLRLTYYTQPAILAVSIACFRLVQEAITVRPAFVAGHSLGEYTALTAAGALSFADAVRTVHERGRFMDEAVPAGVGAMAAVLGAETAALTTLCAEITAACGKPVEVANVNCPGQLVVSGDATAVDLLIARAAEAKARRAIRLDVSGPFHSSMMQPAQAQLSTLLADTRLQSPTCPVVTNVTAEPLTDAAQIRSALAQQVASPVLWEASIHTMLQHGVHCFVEMGPGTVLSGLIRKTDKTATTLHVEDPASLETTVQALASL